VAVYAIGGNRPRIHPTSFVHPLASVAGRVEIGPECFIGPGASLRGDWVVIRLGAGSNVQESCTVHGAPGTEVRLEEGTHLGHGCVVHGAHLAPNVLVGMHAVVLDGAELGEGCVIGSGCVVPAGFVVPAGKLVVGVPGRIVGDVKPEVAGFKGEGTGWYRQMAGRMGADFEVTALEECYVETAGSGETAGAAAWVPWLDELTPSE
jgi:phenylacetic acid degradation protein